MLQLANYGTSKVVLLRYGENIADLAIRKYASPRVNVIDRGPGACHCGRGCGRRFVHVQERTGTGLMYHFQLGEDGLQNSKLLRGTEGERDVC